MQIVEHVTMYTTRVANNTAQFFDVSDLVFVLVEGCVFNRRVDFRLLGEKNQNKYIPNQIILRIFATISFIHD